MSTHTQATATTVRLAIVVEAPIERAFRVFTEDFDRVKPREHNMLEVEIAVLEFDPRALRGLGDEAHLDLARSLEV